MTGAVDDAEQIFQMPVRVGTPIGVKGLTEYVQDPSYATAVGLLLYGMEKQQTNEDENITEVIRINNKIWIPPLLVEKLLVHNHIILEHTNKADEVRNLQQYRFDESSEEIENMVDTLRTICMHCESKNRLLH